ncbi:MAG: response regulator, partial [Paracoccaceae bacterium]
MTLFSVSPLPAATRVVIVDDHPMVAEGIEALLESYDDIQVLATLSDGRQIIDQLDTLGPDLILMDLNMPGVNGLSATEMIVERRPETRILLLSMHDNPEYIRSALSHGARGYCLKDVPTEEIKRAIDVVMSGGTYLCNGAEGAMAIPESPSVEQLTNREQTI